MYKMSALFHRFTLSVVQIANVTLSSRLGCSLTCGDVYLCRFADTEVRSVAVSWIVKSSDDELADYLPQLVQVQLTYQITRAEFTSEVLWGFNCSLPNLNSKSFSTLDVFRH